jgi:hypothetical protein
MMDIAVGIRIKEIMMSMETGAEKVMVSDVKSFTGHKRRMIL